MNDAATPREGLHVLQGEPVPEGLSEGLAQVLVLPPEAKERFEELLLPNLEPMPEDQVEARIARLCRRLDLAVEVAGPALKACRFLLRRAAAHDLSGEQLGEDLQKLGGGPALEELLLPIYEKAKPDLRRELFQATLLSHGKVYGGVEWRIDTLGASNRGRGLNLPVALMTFHYRDGDRVDRITLQMVPDQVRELRAVCDELLKP